MDKEILYSVALKNENGIQQLVSLEKKCTFYATPTPVHEKKKLNAKSNNWLGHLGG